MDGTGGEVGSLPQDRGELRALKLALALYTVIFLLKVGAYLVTGVMALLAEALHTLSDLFVSGFLLVAAAQSSRAPDRIHMFGYGRAQNVAALVAATLFISFTSYRLYEEALPRLIRPVEAAYQHLGLALAVIVVSALVAGIPLVRLFVRSGRGAAAQAQLVELVNDELGLIAAFVGTLFVLRGRPLADPIATLVVATVIAYNGIRLFRENASYLLGRSPGPAFLAETERVVRSVEGVVGVHDLRAEYIGPGVVHVGMHIVVRRGLPIEDADRIAAEVERRVHASVRPGYCVIHVDPAPAENREAQPPAA